MKEKYNPIGFLSNFSLKTIAIIAMTFDHIGYLLFPKITLFRIIGRIAFPILAYLIAEGCRYTKNKLKRFLTMFIISIAYLIFYYIYTKEIYGSIFMSFSFAIFFIFLLMDIKKSLVNKKYLLSSILIVLFSTFLYCAYLLFEKISIDYGFLGMLVPVFVSLFDFKDLNVPDLLKKLDCLWVKVICFAIGLSLVCIKPNLGDIQFYSFVAVAFILLYNGKNGYSGFKYGFYIYYPVHLLVLEVINSII